jgi:MurNAc alpha-1-phosphate uridylyltransferase
MTKITQAFIFCAGRGERMRPLTDSIPKPLVKVKDKSILDYILAKLDEISSLEKIIINAFYLADEIEKHILSLNNPKIILSREEEKVETGGGLIYALDKIDIDKPLLTLNGDVLWRDQNNFSDINFLSENFDINAHDFLLGLKKVEDYWGYDGSSQSFGDFDLIGKKLHHKKSQNEQKVSMSHVYVGLQILNPKVLLGNHEKCFSVGKFYKNAVNSANILNRIEGIELRGDYFHFGTPQHLDLANREY